MPTTRRDRNGGTPRFARALASVVALYALVLQALLGGIAALPVADAPAFLCAQIGDQVGGETAAPDRHPAPDAHHAGCCTAASHAPVAAPPPPSASGPAWPEAAASHATWLAPHRRIARPPPFTLAHARAPPAA